MWLCVQKQEYGAACGSPGPCRAALTPYSNKPQVAPVPHPQVHSSFITWLCLLSPCGPFSDWMNWKGWRFELNNTSYSPTPRPHAASRKKPPPPPLRLTQPIVSCAFFFFFFFAAESLSPLCGCFWKKKRKSKIGASLTLSMYRWFRFLCVIHPHSCDLTYEETSRIGWTSPPSYQVSLMWAWAFPKIGRGSCCLRREHGTCLALTFPAGWPGRRQRASWCGCC